MECEIAVHQVRNRVFRREELNAASEDVLHCSQPVHPNVCAVDDRVNQARSCREIDLRPEGLNKRIADPVEHSSVRNKGVFDVRVSRIDGSSVAPGNPTPNEIQRADNALAVQIGTRIRP